MTRTKKWLAAAAIVAIAAAAVAIYYYIDPARVGWMPRCPFRWLTGWQCPACGNQRALHALLHARWADAWGYNPFLIVSLPYLIALVAARLLRSRRPRFYAAVAHPRVVMTYVVLICLWWVVRNVI